MKPILTLLLAIVALPVMAQTTDCEPDWMIGHWEQAGERSIIQESWIRQDADTILGFGRTIRAATGRVVAQELLRMVRREDQLVFEAKPDANPDWTPFQPTECSGDRLTVENPYHDFPTRLDYRLVAQDTMTVFVSGPDGQGFGLRYVRLGIDRR